MTTTIIKTNSPSSQMKNFTGMESLNFKMVSILVIIILNITSMSSQTFNQNKTAGSIIKPIVAYHKKNTASRPVAPKVYNLHIVREFPILEGVTKQDLKKMEELEGFDYELIFGSAVPKTKTTLKTLSMTSTKINSTI